MSLPGDRDIDTDPTEEPTFYERFQSKCGDLKGIFQALETAEAVIADEDASPSAEKLARRTLKKNLGHASHLMNHLEEVVFEMYEEIQTLQEQSEQHTSEVKSSPPRLIEEDLVELSSRSRVSRREMRELIYSHTNSEVSAILGVRLAELHDAISLLSLTDET